VAHLNAEHAQEHRAVGKPETLALLRRNSKAAADTVRAFSDEQLDAAALVSLNAEAPLTTQFLVEDHALRHSFHHLAQIRAAVGDKREAPSLEPSASARSRTPRLSAKRWAVRVPAFS
jgi:hypothetical protein